MNGQGLAIDRRTLLSVEGGSLIEGLTGIGGVVLAIIGLAGILPELMFSVATIAIGVGLLLQGMAVAARFSAILNETESQPAAVELQSGLSAESIGGIAGIALGILALIGLAPLTLTSVAAIVFGATIILASRVNCRLNTTDFGYGSERAQGLARQAVRASTDLQIVIGFASAVLGILALVHVAPVTMVLVALLSVGVADFLSGASIAGKMLIGSRQV